MAVQGQNDIVYGKANLEAFLRHELCHLSSRYSRMQITNGEL